MQFRVIVQLYDNCLGTSPNIVPRPPFNELPEGEMYSAVPPPEQVQCGTQGEGEEGGTQGEEEDKPVHVLGEQWKVGSYNMIGQL